MSAKQSSRNQATEKLDVCKYMTYLDGTTVIACDDAVQVGNISLMMSRVMHLHRERNFKMQKLACAMGDIGVIAH